MPVSFVNGQTTVPVSVVIPCYCSADTVGRAVESVFSQTSLPSEVILVDDHSPDDGRTVSVLEDLCVAYGNRAQIVVVCLDQNGGAGAARNAGWERASQLFVAFLDSDDAWHPQKIAMQYGFMLSRPDIALTGHGRFIADSSVGAVVEPVGVVNAHIVTGRQLLLSNRFSTSCVMLQRTLPFRFDPDRRYSEDYLLWLEIVLSGLGAATLDVPLTYLFKAPYGESGLSSHLWEMERFELSNYWRLVRKGYVTVLAASGVSAYSFLKYLYRCLIVKLR